MLTRLPDPWAVHEAFLDISGVANITYTSGALSGSNNMASYVPAWFPCDVTVYELRFQATNGTGNYDLGLYDANFNRLISSGSTAMTAAGTKTLAIPEWRIRAGELYYAALALSSTTGTIMRITSTAVRSIMLGAAQQATALPLPNPATPAAPTDTVLPLLGFGVR